MTDKNITQITTADRINRILSRTCSVDLNVLIRLPSGKTLIKGNSAAIVRKFISNDKIVAKNLFINNISSRGVGFLKENSQINIEFVLTNTKIVAPVSVKKVKTHE